MPNNNKLEQSLKNDTVYSVLCFVQNAVEAMAETEEQHGAAITAQGLNGLGAVIHHFKAGLIPNE